MRPISLWVCNMNKEPICLIYDSDIDIYKSAFDINITTQRNGSKVLDFSIRDSGEDSEPRLNLLGIDKEIELVKNSSNLRLGPEWIAACNNLPRNVPIFFHRDIVNKTTSYADSLRIYIGETEYQFYENRSLTLTTGEVTDVRYFNNNNVDTTTEAIFVRNLRFSYSSEPVPNTFDQHNWRIPYLVPEYFIKVTTDDDEDYFIITNDSISHNKRSKQINITCQHEAMLLKYMCLDKEYDGSEEKCVGTARQLVESVLEGTPWSYDILGSDIFYEKKIFGENVEKKRTLKASMKTGAFGIISKIADLFEAKPIYNSSNKTVTLRKMNPFEIDVTTGLPTISAGDSVFELNYGYNLKTVSRTRNTESMVTRLNVQGAFGDTTLGYCGIEETKAYKHVLKANSTTATTYKFTVNDAIDNKTKTYYVFMSGHRTSNELEFYMIDKASELYLFNASQSTEDNPIVYKILPEQTITIASTYELTLLRTEEIDPRLFNFIMDFSYYNENHMISNNAVKKLANFQVYGYNYLQDIKDATAQYSSDYSALSKVIDIVNYNKVAISSFVMDNGFLKINLDLENYPDSGIIYTTQTDELRRNWFKWRTTTGVNKYGNPITSGASVVYLVHNTMGYERLYIKTINYTVEDDTCVESIVLYTDKAYYAGQQVDPSNYQLFIFQNSTTGGYLSAREVEIEGYKSTLYSETEYAGVYHPVYWEDDNNYSSAATPSNYWAWKVIHHKWTETQEHNFIPSELYCCNKGIFNDATYKKCLYGIDGPDNTLPEDCYYYYNTATGVHWRKNSGTWEKVYDEDEAYSANKKLKSQFAKEFTCVWLKVRNVDDSILGLYERYRVTLSSALAANSHVFFSVTPSKYILFSPDVTIQSGKYLEFNTNDNYIYTDQVISSNANILSTKVILSDALVRYRDNEVRTLTEGGIDEHGECTIDQNKKRTGFITVYDGQQYINDSSFAIDVFLYNEAKTFVRTVRLNSGTTVTLNGEQLCRVVTPAEATATTAIFHRVDNKNHILYKVGTTFVDYTYLDGWQHQGVRKGLITQFQNFLTYTEAIYGENGDLAAIKAAQDSYNDIMEDMITALGPIYKQGYWADSNYVDGDEDRLLADAFENLEEIAKPKTTYQIQFTDLYVLDHDRILYGSQFDDWPDISINSAIHLIDDELNIHQWAYVDSLKKCYDDPRKTQITINTNLSDIAQATFQDVMQNIVSVADETKYKSEIYDRAETLSSKGIIAEKVTGTLSTYVTQIESPDSSWATDERGNILFKSTDGSGRVKITGEGILVASSLDNDGTPIWRTAITGSGISADMITTGTLRANVIEAGGITASQLSAGVGEELDISSNKGLLLFATVSGSRPAGRLSVLRDGGSLVNIDSTTGITIASFANVDIESRNTIDIKGSTVNIVAQTVEEDSNDPVIYNPSINMSAGTFNIVGGELNITAYQGSQTHGNINVNSGGNVYIESTGSFRAEHDATKSYIQVGSNGVEIAGSKIDLKTDGEITLCEGNTISRQGILSLFGGNLVINGATGQINTQGQASINAGGAINLSTSNSSLNMSAGAINMSGGALNVTAGAIDITALGQQSQSATLDINSPNFKVVSSTGNVEVAGKIYAKEGQIGCDNNKTGGWTITTNKLSSGTGAYNVALSSDNTIVPSDIQEWNSTTQYVIGNIVKLTVSSVIKYYKAKADSTGKKPGTTEGNTYWEEAEEWFAIWAGATRAINAPFRITRDGSVYLNSLWTVTGPDSSTARKFDLSASVWKLDYHTIKSYTTESQGGTDYCTSVTLSNNTVLNFNRAGSVTRYTFASTGPTEAGDGINFTVTGMKDNVVVIPAIGGQTLTTTMRYYSSPSVHAGSIGATSFITFGTSGQTRSISSTIYEPITVSATLSDNTITPQATFKSSDITGTTYDVTAALIPESENHRVKARAAIGILGNVDSLYTNITSEIERKEVASTYATFESKAMLGSLQMNTADISAYPWATASMNDSIISIVSYIYSVDSGQGDKWAERTIPTSYTVTVSNTFDTEQKKITPSVTIGSLGTITGTYASVQIAYDSTHSSGTTSGTITPKAIIGGNTFLGTTTNVTAVAITSEDTSGDFAIVTYRARIGSSILHDNTLNLTPDTEISKSNNNLKVRSKILHGSSRRGRKDTEYTVTPSITLNRSNLIPSVVIDSLDPITGTDYSVTVSKTIDLQNHTITPYTTIGELGTITGDSASMSEELTIGGGAGVVSVNIVGTAKCGDSPVDIVTAHLYPWAIYEKSNSDFIIKAQIRDASGGTGNIKAQVNVATLAVVSSATIAIEDSKLAITPNSSIGTETFEGTKTTKNVTVSSIINAGTHTITPTATIEDVGTFTGEDKTITAEVEIHGGAALASVGVNALAKCNGTQMNSDTANLYPWALMSKVSSKIRITGQVRDAASGGGNVLATVNIEDKEVTLDASVALSGASATSKTVSITPTATIDSSVFTGTAIDKTIESTLTINGGTTATFVNVVTATTFDGTDATNTSVDFYPTINTSRNSNTKFRVMARIRQGSKSGSVKALLTSDFVITPSAAVASATGGASITPSTTVGSYSYTGTAITATASETHSIDTSTTTIDITPKVTINETDYNGSSSSISYTVGLKEQEASNYYMCAGKVVIGGVETIGRDSVTFYKVSVTPVGTSHTYSTIKLLRSDGAMTIHDTLYEKSGEEYHAVGNGYWHMWYSDVNPYIENSTSGTSYLYENASGETTLYDQGTTTTYYTKE